MAHNQTMLSEKPPVTTMYMMDDGSGDDTLTDDDNSPWSRRNRPKKEKRKFLSSTKPTVTERNKWYVPMITEGKDNASGSSSSSSSRDLISLSTVVTGKIYPYKWQAYRAIAVAALVFLGLQNKRSHHDKIGSNLDELKRILTTTSGTSNLFQDLQAGITLCEVGTLHMHPFDSTIWEQIIAVIKEELKKKDCTNYNLGVQEVETEEEQTYNLGVQEVETEEEQIDNLSDQEVEMEEQATNADTVIKQLTKDVREQQSNGIYYPSQTVKLQPSLKCARCYLAYCANKQAFIDKWGAEKITKVYQGGREGGTVWHTTNKKDSFCPYWSNYIHNTAAIMARKKKANTHDPKFKSLFELGN
jgi:hypothetical protein